MIMQIYIFFIELLHWLLSSYKIFDSINNCLNCCEVNFPEWPALSSQINTIFIFSRYGRPTKWINLADQKIVSSVPDLCFFQKGKQLDELVLSKSQILVSVVEVSCFRTKNVNCYSLLQYVTQIEKKCSLLHTNNKCGQYSVLQYL